MKSSPLIEKLCQLWAGIKSAILGVRGEIADSEPLSRYILSSGWLDKSDAKKPRLKPEAFIPHPDIETSVYRVNGWGMADHYQRPKDYVVAFI